MESSGYRGGVGVAIAGEEFEDLELRVGDLELLERLVEARSQAARELARGAYDVPHARRRVGDGALHLWVLLRGTDITACCGLGRWSTG